MERPPLATILDPILALHCYGNWRRAHTYLLIVLGSCRGARIIALQRCQNLGLRLRWSLKKTGEERGSTGIFLGQTESVQKPSLKSISSIQTIYRGEDHPIDSSSHSAPLLFVQPSPAPPLLPKDIIICVEATNNHRKSPLLINIIQYLGHDVAPPPHGNPFSPDTVHLFLAHHKTPQPVET